ncbi:hypothetical protein ZIOFF_054643 [Zingiber officinale]|uniref:Uncharacterized protein n=1 Tax=Zingiber officinale TaxID=94328 RepID=A0A8J5FKD2_ZINOF|nr:hypothetical protein ZIOFF_054643 [Zingiber officinale]
MSSSTEEGAPIINEGRFLTMLVCWLLGNGCLFSMNSLLTIEDYFSFYSNCVGCCNFWKRWHWSIFIGVCFVSGAFGIADAHVQGGMVGDLSLMSQELIQVRYQCQSNSLKISESNQTRSFLVNAESFLAGLAASGALTSALRLITKAAFENSQNGFREQALMFFSISCFFELVCILLYAFVFPKVPIVKYYREKAASECSMTVSADLAAGGMHKHQVQEVEDPKLIERLSNKQLLLENIDYAIDLFLIYVLTLSIFPGFLSEDTDSHSLGSWYALVLIAMYNVWDLIGRYIPLLKPLGPQQNALENLLVVCLFAGIFAGVMLDWLWLIGKGW